MAEKDRISGLPANVLDNILGFLPIQEAARTAVLSTFWKDLWLSLTKLNFDFDFFNSDALNQRSALDVINKILMRHNGTIRKFLFHFLQKFESASSVIDSWLLLLTQNGVEEVDLELYCRVPSCIFSCPTLRRLKLSRVSVELVNAYCVLPNVTSLFLEYVFFKPRKHRDYVLYLLMLEDLSFDDCGDMFYFNIVAPKLNCLKIISFKCSCCDDPKEFGLLPPNLDLRSISCLDLVGSVCCFEEFFKHLTRVGHQLLALTIEHMKLSIFGDYVNISEFIHLLRICPKLCELDIGNLKLNTEEFKLLEELNSVALTQNMLHTLKFSRFNGSRFAMQTVKVLLACFPGVENVVITPSWRFDSKKEFKIMQELVCFPRASTKAEIVYM